MRFLILIPTFNESENIGRLLESISNFRENFEIKFDLLVIDDNSPDGTALTVSGLNIPFVHVLQRKTKDGLGKAYLAGFNWAKNNSYDFVIEMDADFSHRVEDLPGLLRASPDLALVMGSRWIVGGKIVNWPTHRVLISKIGNIYAQKLLGLKQKDLTSGFRRLSVNTLDSIPLDEVMTSGYGFQIEMVYKFHKLKQKIEEIPITFVERERGESKMTSRIALEAFINVARMAFGRLR